MASGCDYYIGNKKYTESEFKKFLINGGYASFVNSNDIIPENLKPNQGTTPERSVATKDAQGTEPTLQNISNEASILSGSDRAIEDINPRETTEANIGSKVDNTSSGEGNGAPPSGEGVAADEKQPKGNKSLANRLVDASNLSKEVKDGIAKEGLSYAPRSHKEAEDIAKSIIDTEGIDSAVLQARAQTFGGDVNTLIQTEALNRLFDLENKATTKEEKLEHAKKFAEIGIELDKWAREKAGRGISALAYFYKKSPIGIQMMENAKRKEDFEQWSKPKDKSWKEFFDEMMKEPEFAVQVKEELKKERQDARKERIKKVDDSIDKLIDDIESGKAAFSSVVPPPIIIAALKTAKAAYHAGESVAKIIQDAVDFVTEKMGGATWDSEKFRKKAEELLKENEPKKKLTDEELKAKILDRFRKKLKGLSSKEQEEIIRRSFKEIVENGGLQYDDFKKIIAEVTGRGEMTAEEAVRIKELVEKTNAVDDAAKKAQADRTEESLTKYRAAQLQAAAAGKELNELLNTRPNIIKRLTSIMQLNTLGIAALVNNPIYNIWNQATLRLPIGMVNTVLEQGIKLVKKDYVPETNFIFAQKEFFSKLGLGTRESIGQIWSGLNRMDYIQKELYGQQIKPLKSAQDLWDFHQGKINLTKQQVTDKIIQALPNAWFAEAVARALNVGDKPQRFGAEGAQASVFAKNLGLKDIDYKLFIEFPKEEAYAAYKKQGLSDNEAAKKSEYVKDVIIREGERSTFQQDNMLNDALTKMFGGEKSGIGSLAKAVLVSPYLKIPLNAYWSYYNLINPEVAFLQSAIYGTRAYKNRNKGDNTAAKQFHEAKYWFAHGVVGIATRAVVLGLVSAGIFVPKNDEDDTKKEREGEQNYQRQGGINMTKLKALLNGKNPDDIKNGLMVDNRWWGHFGTIGNAIAKKNEEMTPSQFKEQREWWDAIFGGMEVDAIKDLNQGVFSNTSSLFSALNEGGINAQRWSLSTINLFTNIVQPASVAQISRAQLPYQASNKADTFLGQVKNQMLQRSSWLRKLTGEYPPSKISIWGDEMKTNDNAAMKMFGISNTNKDAFAYPLFEDYQKTKDIGFFPPAVLPTLNKIKLNTEQTRKLETYIGQARKDLVAPYVNDMAEIEGYDGNYKQLNVDEKKKVLSYLYSMGRGIGVSRFVKEYPSFEKAEETEEEQMEDERHKFFKAEQKAKNNDNQ